MPRQSALLDAHRFVRRVIVPAALSSLCLVANLSPFARMHVQAHSSLRPAGTGTPFTCARYGYALDVPAGWYSEPVQGTPRVSGDCLAHPSDTGDTSASFTQDKSRSGFAEVVGA